MLKIDPNVVLDYSANVLPKNIQKLPSNELDKVVEKAVEKAVECANKDNKEGLKSAMELIGRIMTNKK